MKKNWFGVPHFRKQRSKTADPPGNSQFLSPGPMAVGAITAHAVATGGKKKNLCSSEQKGALGWFRRAESPSKVWKIYEKDEHTWEFTDLRQIVHKSLLEFRKCRIKPPILAAFLFGNGKSTVYRFIDIYRGFSHENCLSRIFPRLLRLAVHRWRQLNRRVETTATLGEDPAEYSWWLE